MLYRRSSYSALAFLGFVFRVVFFGWLGLTLFGLFLMWLGGIFDPPKPAYTPQHFKYGLNADAPKGRIMDARDWASLVAEQKVV